MSPASTSHNKMSPKEAVVLIMPKMHKFREFIGDRSRGYRCFKSSQCSSLGARDGAVVRVLTSHQSGPGSNPGINAICGLSLLLVLSFAPRGFSPGTPVFPSPQKPTFPNSNSTRNQVDEEPLCGCATSKSLFINLSINLFFNHINFSAFTLNSCRAMKKTQKNSSRSTNHD